MMHAPASRSSLISGCKGAFPDNLWPSRDRRQFSEVLSTPLVGYHRHDLMAHAIIIRSTRNPQSARDLASNTCTRVQQYASIALWI